MPSGKKLLLLSVYFLATVQFAWCYFWLTRPYVSTRLYELGRERMPFVVCASTLIFEQMTAARMSRVVTLEQSRPGVRQMAA